MKEYGTVIFKPDSVRDILENLMLADMECEGIEVVWRKYRQFNPDDVARIYPQQLDYPTYPSAVKAMCSGPALILLVRGDNIHQRLKEIKGKMDKGGLRLKYKTYTKDQLMKMGLSGDALMDKLAENRLHSSDSTEEAIAICSMCMDTYDLELVHGVDELFYNSVKRQTALRVISG